ncbi:MAG: HIT family protein [Candidatus Sericytochromatia bacterium]|jgi:histidine triad (HIT) family protein
MASIFTKIINGEIPSYKVFEDEYTYAFLDINPINLGHTLIVPKIEEDYFLDVPEPYYSAVFKTAKVVAGAIHQATGCVRVGTVIAGFDVPHFHYHLVPMNDISDLDFKKGHKRTEDEMLETLEKIKAILNH